MNRTVTPVWLNGYKKWRKRVENSLNIINRIWNWFLELLYPKTCCFCGSVSTQELCDNCREQVFYIQEPRCKKCGKPIRYEEQEYCMDCQKRTFHYVQGRSLWIHKGVVPWSIYQFKYRNRRLFGKFYARELYRIYGEKIREWGIDLIVPVPLHRKRKRKRGYNQSEIVARQLAELTGIPINTKLIFRKAYTQPQKTLDDKGRIKNVHNAFKMGKTKVEGKNILLIDDIYTTGSTIDAISKKFLEEGHNKVWFLTISIGQDF